MTSAATALPTATNPERQLSLRREPRVPAHLAGEWQLFTDWCAATGHPALPTSHETVRAYLADLPATPAVQARRVRAIRAAHRLATRPDPAPLTPARSHPVGDRYLGAGYADPNEVLADLAQVDYPAGVAARRDALIVLLCRVRGLTRRQALTARPDIWPVPSLNGADLRFTSDPRACPACALTRWLRIQSAHATGGRSAVENTIGGTPRGWHDCREEVPPGWAGQPLLPPVDRHAWINPHQTLSRRGISTVLRLRLSTASQRHDRPRQSPPTRVHTDDRLTIGLRDHDTAAELDELLERLEEALDRAQLTLDRVATHGDRLG